MKRVVKVEWIDSCSSNLNWVFLEDLRPITPLKLITYGVLIFDTNESVTIAQNYGEEFEQVCNIMTIPKGCIKNIEQIDVILEEHEKEDKIEGNEEG